MIPAWLLPDFDVSRFGVPTTTRQHVWDDSMAAEAARLRARRLEQKRVRQKKYYDANKELRQAKARAYYRRKKSAQSSQG